jgi:EF-hand domain pair
MNTYYLILATLLVTEVKAFIVQPISGCRLQMSVASSSNHHFMEEAVPIIDESKAQDTDKIEMPKTEKPKVSKQTKGHSKDGLLSPIVTSLKAVIGDDELNKLRGKVIAMHSDIIKSFVDTADTRLGQAVLKMMFDVADVDGSGTVERDELERSLKALGFRFLNEKQIKGIFDRADLDKDGHIDLDEWLTEAPKTLRTNLVKLAKQNGGDMGLLA